MPEKRTCGHKFILAGVCSECARYLEMSDGDREEAMDGSAHRDVEAQRIEDALAVVRRVGTEEAMVAGVFLRSALDALLARLEQVEKERDKAWADVTDAAVRADRAEARVEELERRVVELVEGHDLERLTKEIDSMREERDTLTAPQDFQQCKDCAWDICWQSKSCRLKAAPDTAPKGKVKWSRGTDGGTTGVHRVPPDTAEER